MRDLALEQDLLVSLAIGDGCFTKTNYLNVCHTAKHKEYVAYKFSVLKPYCARTMRIKTRTFFTKGKLYAACSFSTRALFKEYREKFYKASGRVIPVDFGQLMNSRVLAFWYMDDGSLQINRHPTLELNRYTKKESKHVQRVLLDVFGLETTVFGPAGRLRLSFRNTSVPRFTELVKPTMQQIKCMQYKLPTEFTKVQACCVCGKVFLPKRGNRWNTYACSPACSRKHNLKHKREITRKLREEKRPEAPERVCVYCGKKYRSSTFTQKTCSIDCSKEYKNLRRRERRSVDRKRADASKLERLFALAKQSLWLRRLSKPIPE